jgi:WD40 repeat protein
MLIGCTGGGGVRAWHADTRRIMADVPAEPGFPHVAALAACPSEPAFAVAANSALLPAQLGNSSAATTAAAAAGVSGRLAMYNGRSFKRSAVLGLPDEVGLASLAYSSSGNQLVVGSTAGSALLYEPSSRSSPLRVWQVATALPAAAAAGGLLPVHVAWRASSASSALAGGAAAAPSSSSSSGGSFLTLCCGVLCEWGLAGMSSRTPLLAVDVIAAAAAALEQQPVNPVVGGSEDMQGIHATETQQQTPALPVGNTTSVSRDMSSWVCRYVVSPDGSRVVVVACQASAGVLLLYDLPATCSSSSSSSGIDALVQPQVLLQGDVLAGGCCVSWHPREPVLVVGCGSSNCSLTINLSRDCST